MGDQGGSQVTSLKKYRSHNLKALNIMLEYRQLKEDPPLGVYLLPTFDNARRFSGVIFLDKGLYKNAIFKFELALPEEYPAEGALPKLIFSSRVYHPLVDNQTNQLDLEVQFQRWNPANENHNLHGVMRYVKRIFYLKDFTAIPRAANKAAWLLVKTNQTRFLENVEDCVQNSMERSFKNEPGSSIRFTDYSKQHDINRDRVLQSLS